MLKYKMVKTANGRIQYWKNGKMVKKSDIPADIVFRLEPGVELQLPSPQHDAQMNGQMNGQMVDLNSGHATQYTEDKPHKSCFICNNQAIRARLINLTTVNLCDECYRNTTTGNIVAKMKGVEKRVG